MNKHIAILDTEVVSIYHPLTYNIGLLIAEKQQNGLYKAIEGYDFLVKSIYGQKDLMRTAHGKTKRSLITQRLRQRKLSLKHYGHIIKLLESRLKNYGIDTIYAYNAPADKRALKLSEKNKLKNGVFKDIEWKDLYRLSDKLIHKTSEYKAFAIQNHWQTQKGRIQATLEKTLGFLAQNSEFTIRHLALPDCEVALDLLNELVERGYSSTS